MTTTDFAQSGSVQAPERIVITDPRDGSVVGGVRVTSASEVSALIGSGLRAFERWSTTSPAERGGALRAAAGAVIEREDELAALNARETGRRTGEALAGIRAGADALLQYSELGPLHFGTRLLGGADALDYSVPEPRGLVAVITPWNDPVAVSLGLIGAALVTGNVVVHKPSERCPHLGIALGAALEGAFPAGVISTVSGGATVGELLVRDERVSAVAHVGSTRAGEAISRAAMGTGAHVIRENGGNDALVVDEDVSPRWAAQQAALGCFANSGQICTSVERIFIHRRVANAFIVHLVSEARHLTATGDLGPLVDDALRDAVNAQVTAAIASGARSLVGGSPRDGAGSYYPATVLVDCTPDMTIMREETFGPVAPICIVETFEEGLRLAAADRYGLAATVLTASMSHAIEAAARLPVGTVKINAVFGGAPGGSAQPRGASGAGFGYGPGLLDELTTTKVVHIALPGEGGDDNW